MALETGTYISDLVATNPTAADPKSQGDDHLRLLKSAIKATFPLITGAVNVTHTALGYVANVTSDIQAQLNIKASSTGQAWSGIHDFTSATLQAVTQSLGDRSSKAATTQFVGNEFAPISSPNLTGIPTAPTAPLGTSTTQMATTQFVASTAFSSALPAQTGNTGKFITTDGTNASWVSIPAGASIYTAQQFGAF